MPVIVSALTIGLILSLLAVGVLISFRIFDFPDITADGSLTTGAAIAAKMIAMGYNPFAATAVALFGGLLAGALTGTLHARFGLNKLLSGILVMIALYSINLHIMGASNITLLFERTVITDLDGFGRTLLPDVMRTWITDAGLTSEEVVILGMSLLGVGAIVVLLLGFFKTRLGLAMRASGNNPGMVRALGVNDRRMLIIGLALSNGLIALSGALFAQFSGYADIQLGIGMIVFGLASVIIGETVIAKKTFGYSLAGAVAGSVIFRLAVAFVMFLGLPQQDLKLVTALFVFIALILPRMFAARKRPAMGAA